MLCLLHGNINSSFNEPTVKPQACAIEALRIANIQESPLGLPNFNSPIIAAQRPIPIIKARILRASGMPGRASPEHRREPTPVFSSKTTNEGFGLRIYVSAAATYRLGRVGTMNQNTKTRNALESSH